MAAKDRDEKGKFAKGNKAGGLSRSNGEATKNGRKGGIASGEARREKRKWREMLEDLLELPIEITLPDKSKKSVTMNDAILFGQIKAATAGKTEAAKFLAQLKGELVEKVETKQEVNVKTEDEYAGLPIESQERIARVILEERHKQYERIHNGKTEDSE